MTPIGPRWYEMEELSEERPPLAEKVNQNLLLDFRHCPESELAGLDPSIPLGLSLMVAVHDGRVLLVHNTLAAGVGAARRRARRGRDRAAGRRTRVPGGDRHPADPASVDFVGIGTVQLGHERRIEYVAVYATHLDHLDDFEANDEVDKLAWWDVAPDFPGLSPIDQHLARLALGAE